MAIAGFGGVRPPDLGGRRPTGFTGTAAPRTKPASAPYTSPNAPAGSSFLQRPIFEENPMTFTQFGPMERGQLRPTGISIWDPEGRGGGPGRPRPWDEPRKGEPGFGGTPMPTPTEEPTPEPESQPQTFFEKFPTPQDAWKDWLSRMGKFLARQPGEVPNFPGPWGSGRTGGRDTDSRGRTDWLKELLGRGERGLMPEDDSSAPFRGIRAL